MSVANEELSAKQERGVAALLTEMTNAAAAAKAGVSEATMQRWLAGSEAFRRAYRDARRRLVDDALLTAQKAARSAVAALLRNLRCGKPACEIRAAEALLGYVARGVELADLAGEIADLERRLEARKA